MQALRLACEICARHSPSLAVEEEDRVARRHAQHVEQVVGLPALGRHIRAAQQGCADEEALSLEVVGHRWMQW
jgi:hypothetical protein